ncbi:MAG: GAF domain-containing protein [Deltaproteobacteria bacterium]|nr:GAF domain-containing protein [Deltaproteobacteria bacterium]
MKLTFWGSRGSIARAGRDTVRYGGNTSCVTIESSSGALIVLDCGTGGFGLARHLMETGGAKRGHLLFGHTHWDHIQGLPFFGPMFERGNKWDVYGPRGIGRTMRDLLAGQMQYEYFPVELSDLGADMNYHDLLEGSFDIEDIKVTAQYLNHPALTLAYKLEVDGVTVVYSTDHEPRSALLAMGKKVPAAGEDERHARFLEDADLVIHDAQYLAEEYEQRRGWGHSTVEYVVDTAEAVNVRSLALFHHDPSRTDEDIDVIVKNARARLQAQSDTSVFAAAEGQVIEMTPRPRKTEPPRPHEVSALSMPNQVVEAGSVVAFVPQAEMLSRIGEALRSESLDYTLVDRRQDVLAEVLDTNPSLVVLGWTGAETLTLARELFNSRNGDLPPVIVCVAESEDPVMIGQGPGMGIRDWMYAPFSSIYARTWLRSWLLRTSFKWRPATLPPDEIERLRALESLNLLDTPPEERFDRTTRIASALFDAPIALISLIDSDRQWFKSSHGMEVQETPREVAFCAHTILDDQLMEVPDTLQDERFADNPAVAGEPRVRFYAGVPLKSPSGHRVGSLCVLDNRPRTLTDAQRQLLRDLGQLVEVELGFAGEGTVETHPPSSGE